MHSQHRVCRLMLHFSHPVSCEHRPQTCSLSPPSLSPWQPAHLHLLALLLSCPPACRPPPIGAALHHGLHEGHARDEEALLRAREGGERPAPSSSSSSAPLPSHHCFTAEGEHGQKRTGGVKGPDGRAGNRWLQRTGFADKRCYKQTGMGRRVPEAWKDPVGGQDRTGQDRAGQGGVIDR